MEDLELEVRSNGDSSIDLDVFPKVGPLSPPLNPPQTQQAQPKPQYYLWSFGIACVTCVTCVSCVNTVLLALLLARQ